MGMVFVSDNLALDFVGTLNERTSSRVECLTSDEDVRKWLLASGAVGRLPGQHQSARPGETLGVAIRLREALFRTVSRMIDEPDRPPSASDRELINTHAAEPTPVPRLSRTGAVTLVGDVRSGLAAVARDGLALFDEPRDALKWCADDQCTHPFLDRSRGHRRRWCGMAGCGDRAKAAAYRARRRG